MNHHPSNLDSFYAKHPSFIWGPLTLAASVYGLCALPRVASHLNALGAKPYGLTDAATYTAFAAVLSYATHGWMCIHLSQTRQLQAYDREDKTKPAHRAAYKDKVPPEQEAVRTIAALLTSLVYTVFPFAPATSTWGVWVAWTCAFAVYWDLHFFVCHKCAHEYGPAYRFFHKLHHENKQPGPFNAYFVTYQSHFFAEHLVVLIGAMCGLPRDVFTWTLYWGTLGTFVEHCGHDVGSVKLPLLGQLGLTWGLLSTALSPWSLVLGGEAPAEHDWHHEKFTTNYALSFQYLDKLFGTYHPGREAGVALQPLPAVETTPLVPLSSKTRISSVASEEYGPLYRSMPMKPVSHDDTDYEDSSTDDELSERECVTPTIGCF